MWFSVHLSFFYVIDDIHSYLSTFMPLKQESLTSVFLFMKKPAVLFFFKCKTAGYNPLRYTYFCFFKDFFLQSPFKHIDSEIYGNI